MLTSGSHKMLKILIEIRVQVFHDNNFLLAVLFFLFFGFMSFGLYYIGLMVAYCPFRWLKIFLCACLCLEGEGDLITSYQS